MPAHITDFHLAGQGFGVVGRGRVRKALFWVALALMFINAVRVYRAKIHLKERLGAPYLDRMPVRIDQPHEGDSLFMEQIKPVRIGRLSLKLPETFSWREAPSNQAGVRILRGGGGRIVLGCRSKTYPYQEKDRLRKSLRKIFYSTMDPRLLLAKKKRLLPGLMDDPQMIEQVLGPWGAFIISGNVSGGPSSDSSQSTWNAVKFELVQGNDWVELVFYQKEGEKILGMDRLKDLAASVRIAKESDSEEMATDGS